MSAGRRARVRSRLREVDSVIAALSESGVEFDSLTKAQQLPKEKDMPARDKYTTFSRYGFKHRKSVHKVPHFTKVTNRTNPAGF